MDDAAGRLIDALLADPTGFGDLDRAVALAESLGAFNKAVLADALLRPEAADVQETIAALLGEFAYRH